MRRLHTAAESRPLSPQPEKACANNKDAGQPKINKVNGRRRKTVRTITNYTHGVARKEEYVDKRYPSHLCYGSWGIYNILPLLSIPFFLCLQQVPHVVKGVYLVGSLELHSGGNWAHVVLLILSCWHLPLLLTTDHGIRRQPQRVSQNPGTHFSLFLLCNSKCISPLITRINHSSQHKSSPTHLSLPAHPGHDESETARCQSQFLGFPGVASGKEPPCQCRRWFDSWIGKIPWRRRWQPTPVFLFGESHGQRTPWQSMGSQTVGHSWSDLALTVSISKSMGLRWYPDRNTLPLHTKTSKLAESTLLGKGSEKFLSHPAQDSLTHGFWERKKHQLVLTAESEHMPTGASTSDSHRLPSGQY